MKIHRRHFLAALGATGAWLGLDSNRKAQANAAENPLRARAENGEPLRFVGVYTPHGRAHELWAPGPNFDLSYDNAILAPFDDPSRFGRATARSSSCSTASISALASRSAPRATTGRA